MSGSFIKNNLLRFLIVILLIIGFFIFGLRNELNQNSNDSYTQEQLDAAIQNIQESDASDNYKKYQTIRIKQVYELDKSFERATSGYTQDLGIENYNNIYALKQEIVLRKTLKEHLLLVADSFKKLSNEYLTLVYGSKEKFPTGPYSHSEFIEKQNNSNEQSIKYADGYINFFEYLLTIQEYISIENGEIYIDNSEALSKYDSLINNINTQDTISETLDKELKEYKKIYEEKNSEYLF